MKVTISGVKQVKIKIGDIDDIREFVQSADINGARDIYLTSGENNMHMVSATSIMGVLSLDLEKPINMIYDKEYEGNEQLQKLIERFKA